MLPTVAPGELGLTQAMLVGHGYPADDRADDANEALVRAANKQVLEMCGAVELFFRCAIDCAVVVPCKPSNGRWSKHVGVDNVPTEIGHESHRRFSGPFVRL